MNRLARALVGAYKQFWFDLIFGPVDPKLDSYVSTTVPYDQRTTLET